MFRRIIIITCLRECSFPQQKHRVRSSAEFWTQNVLLMESIMTPKSCCRPWVALLPSLSNTYDGHQSLCWSLSWILIPSNSQSLQTRVHQSRQGTWPDTGGKIWMAPTWSPSATTTTVTETCRVTAFGSGSEGSANVLSARHPIRERLTLLAPGTLCGEQIGGTANTA